MFLILAFVPYEAFNAYSQSSTAIEWMSWSKLSIPSRPYPSSQITTVRHRSGMSLRHPCLAHIVGKLPLLIVRNQLPERDRTGESIGSFLVDFETQAIRGRPCQ